MSRQMVASVLSKRDAGTQIMPRSVNTTWYNEAVAKIEEKEYAVTRVGSGDGYGAINHIQHLGYLFGREGYYVNNFNADGSTKNSWRTGFLLSGIGRGGSLRRSSLLHASREGEHSVSYDYSKYTVRYENRKEGMEQSFFIRQRPAGAGPLDVAIELKGDLEAFIGAGNVLELHAAGNAKDVKMVYDQFRVWDSHKKALTAHMRLEGAHRLVLSVDDSHAVYPITVDPLNHTPSATLPLTGVFGSTVNEIATPVLGGYSLSGVGDVNGDGTDDLIIGAPLFTTLSLTGGAGTISGLAKGAAFVYYGVVAGVPSSTPSQVLQPTGLTTAALFGFSVSGAGDLDGDGKGDIVVGAPGQQISIAGVFPQPPLITVNCGVVYVFKGSSMGTDVNVLPAPASALTLSNAEIGALTINPLYGFSVASAGDITNDGFDDIIIGVPGAGLGAGRVDIYNGANNANGVAALTPTKTITGALTGGLFGFSVSGAGDVNSDGFSDVVVGAPGVLISLLQGRAYIFHGSALGITPANSLGATGTAGTSLSAPGIALLGTLFGFSVSAAGDVNHDGHSDVIIGEPLHLDGIAAAGQAYIYYGTGAATGVGAGSPAILRSPRSPTILGTGIPLNLLFGFSVGNAGNVVGDIADDVVVGEPGSAVIANTTLLSVTLSTLGITLNTATQVLSGAVYLFNGNNVAAGITTNQVPYWKLQNSDVVTAADMLGSSVHYAGDINKDGFADFLVGSPSGGLDLGVNLSNRATNVSLSVGNGLFATGNSNAGNSYLFFGFSSALPVTLLSFTGAAAEGGVQLDWSTSQELNSDHFEIERSTDNSQFTKIGQVAAAHNSSLPRSYDFLDVSPSGGTNYYRLKMVDMDGSSTYSKVIAVSFSADGPRLIGVYPNPVHGSFRLLFRNMPAGRYDMNLLNPIGQVIMTKRIQVSSSVNYNETVDLAPALAQGSYMIRVVDQQQHVFVTRVVVN